MATLPLSEAPRVAGGDGRVVLRYGRYDGMP